MCKELKIKIYRGANQIGGCATEISYGEERILIDLGANLPGTDKNTSISDRELLEKVFDGRVCKAVLFTHYHGDHYGLYREVPSNVDMYMGETSKEIVSVVAKTLSQFEGTDDLKTISTMKTFKHGVPIFKTGEIQVTPIMTDHSAIDAYMFLVEAAGKKILFTGDFRDHGIASENNRFWKTIEEYVPENVDVLITEGTMMSRTEEVKQNIVHTEAELGAKAKEEFKKCDYNFVLVSSTNLDTIMELYRNTPIGKMFVVDAYQAEMMLTAMKLRKDLFDKYGAQELKKGEFCKPIYVIGKRKNESDQVYLKDEKRDTLKKMAKEIHSEFYVGYADYKKMREKGFVMLVRQNRFSENYENCFEEAIKEFSDKKTQLIYSMWKGYVEGDKKDEHIVRLVNMFPGRTDLHTSGHAYVETIAKLINVVQPKKVIPMHTEFAKGFVEKKEFADCTAEVVLLKDMESYVLMPVDKERMTSQKIAMENMSFEDDKYSVCGWKTALREKDIRVPRLDDEKKYKKFVIDLVMVNPSKREMILVEYKCNGRSMVGGRYNIAQCGIDYMQILYSNHMAEIRDEFLNEYNVYRKMKNMPELSKDTYNEYKVKVGFLFVDKICANGVVVSEISEDDYKKGMKLLNSNCQYLGDNLVYIRARTLDHVKLDDWKVVRDSEFEVTI